MIACPSPSCELVITSHVFDERLGSIVEVRCASHARVMYGSDSPPLPMQRVIRE